MMDLQAAVQAIKGTDPAWVAILGGSGFLGAIVGYLFKIDRTMTRMEVHMATHTQHDHERFAEVEKKFEGVDRRADGMRGAIHEIGEKIAGLTDTIVARVQEIVSRVEMKVEDQGKRIDDVLIRRKR